MVISTIKAVFRFEEGEILNFYKPVGKSSFYIVKVVRAITGVKKVGHAGTLDPFADGVLIICTGKATKEVPRLMDLPKEYIGTIKLGEVRDTDDVTGRILRTAEVPPFMESEIHAAAAQFIGEFDQVPPMYSARKHQGQRLYQLARKGVVIERPPKRVKVYDLRILNIRLPYIKLWVRCSKGTYIRSLARDLGEAFGCGAYLHELTRTCIGDFHIDDSYRMERFKQLVSVHKTGL